MKTFQKISAILMFVCVYSYNALAGPTGRAGAEGDDNEWLKFLIIGLVVGALVGFFIGKSMGNSKK